MIREKELPEELVNGYGARKLTLEGIDEVQCMYVVAKTTIALHYHEDSQWEVWIFVEMNQAYICPIGEPHTLINDSNTVLTVMAIKGHKEYTYEELEQFFRGLGYEVHRGSVMLESTD